MTTPALTPRQAEYVSFIRSFTAEHGRPPTSQQLVKALAVGTSTVSRMMRTLEGVGVIVRKLRNGGITIRDRIPIADFLPPDVWLSITFEAERRAVRPEVIISAICRQHFAGATKGLVSHAKG